MSKLIFVYNADSGFMNGMFDLFHKMMKPSSYSCDLCKITHNHTGMRKGWKNYLGSLKIEKDFLHKDEFKKQFPNYASIELPGIFVQDDELTQIISAKDLKGADLNQLTNLLKDKLNSSRLGAKLDNI